MKNKELYFKTVDILVKAYLNETLEHGNCFHCAVGNLVAANMGFTFDEMKIWKNKSGFTETPLWDHVFVSRGKNIQETRPQYYIGLAKAQIDSTGYTWQNLAMIEKSFESANGNMFNGLMAVVEALDIIHENTDQELTTEIKAKFQKVNQ